MDGHDGILGFVAWAEPIGKGGPASAIQQTSRAPIGADQARRRTTRAVAGCFFPKQRKEGGGGPGGGGMTRNVRENQGRQKLGINNEGLKGGGGLGERH